MVRCCVVDCPSSSSTPGVVFYNFPGRSYEIERKEKWIRAVNRINNDGTPWQPYKKSVICNRHFVGGKRSTIANHPAYVPSIFPKVYRRKSFLENNILSRYERAAKRNKIKKLPDPSNASDDNIVSLVTTPVETKEKNLEEPSTSVLPSISKSVSTQAYFPLNSDLFEFSSSHDFTNLQTVSTSIDCGTQCNIVVVNDHVVIKKDAGCGTQNYLTVCRGGFHGFESASKNEVVLKDLTGTSLETFSRLLAFVPELCSRALPRPNVLMLFLMKMKMGLSFNCLGVLFGVDRTTASRLFTTILEVLSLENNKYVVWPSRSAVKKTLPAAFKNLYPNARVIIDYTEVKTETPFNVDDKDSMYSKDKSAYTFKFLQGVAPNGQISFLSKCYGGGSSNSFIASDSGFLSLLEEGDEILDDNGIPGLRIENGAVIKQIPQNDRFSESELLKKKSIASVRKHVDKCIQRIETFKILNCVKNNLFPHMNNIVKVCCILTNFQPPIIHDKTDDHISI